MTEERALEVEQALGLNPTIRGLLACAYLSKHIDWRQALHYDWPHTLLQEGVLSHESVAFIRALERKREFRQRDWDRYLRHGWHFPAALHHAGKDLHRLFNEYRSKKRSETGSMKVQSSQLLNLYSLVRRFIGKHVPRLDGDMDLEIASFVAVCRSVDIILAAKRGQLPLREAAGNCELRMRRTWE
jgi:hypothetical protein